MKSVVNERREQATPEGLNLDPEKPIHIRLPIKMNDFK
jgi:hypothetical protein